MLSDAFRSLFAAPGQFVCIGHAAKACSGELGRIQKNAAGHHFGEEILPSMPCPFVRTGDLELGRGETDVTSSK